MAAEVISMPECPSKLVGISAFTGTVHAEDDVAHEGFVMDSLAQTSKTWSNIDKNPDDGKENSYVEPRVSADSCESCAETVATTPTKTRKSSGPFSDDIPSLCGTELLFNRDVGVKNTFVHMSPEHVKPLPEIPPHTVPSNFWSSGSLFSREVLRELNDDRISVGTSAAAREGEHDAIQAVPTEHVEWSGVENKLRTMREFLPTTGAGILASPGLVPSTPEVFNCSDAGHFADFSRLFPADRMPPPLPHSIETASTTIDGPWGVGSVPAASVATAAAVGMAQAAAAFAAAAAGTTCGGSAGIAGRKLGVVGTQAMPGMVAASGALDATLPPPMVPPLPPLMPTSPSLSAVPPPPSRMPTVSTSSQPPPVPTKVIRLLDHIAGGKDSSVAAVQSQPALCFDAHGPTTPSEAGGSFASAPQTTHVRLQDGVSTACNNLPLFQQSPVELEFNESHLRAMLQSQLPMFPQQQGFNQFQQHLHEALQAVAPFPVQTHQQQHIQLQAQILLQQQQLQQLQQQLQLQQQQQQGAWPAPAWSA
eukprot:TRINITY_DN2919_c0_g1_i2.p1 TRINITY_DN2919_c0_g1~~TRINITY_DN2919_c0_g1_i2.p1  ORF type:complete len:535 (+),score=108.53 TRINITY_DN2919_c0_g1_i2:55-1659(+)